MKSIGPILLFTFLIMLTACSDSGSGSSDTAADTNASSTAGYETTPTPSHTGEAARADEKTDAEPDFVGTTDKTEKKNKLKELALLTAVRTGGHNGFDRMVFEFEGAEMPGYLIEYIDKPVQACGSGNEVPLKGEGWLQMRFEPALAHTIEGEPTLRFRELEPKLPVVLEMKSTCDFEGQVEWVAGVASPNRYRVLELQKPTRLVVDIMHK